MYVTHDNYEDNNNKDGDGNDNDDDVYAPRVQCQDIMTLLKTAQVCHVDCAQVGQHLRSKVHRGQAVCLWLPSL